MYKHYIQNLPISNSSIKLDILRADKNHPFISGNKLWKLKYHIIEVQKINSSHLVSFGGAYSNHIYSLAYAGNQHHLKTIAFIRGNELAEKPLNSTLKQAQDWGMEFVFINREEYRQKWKSSLVQNFLKTLENPYLIPEGGTDDRGVKGVSEVLNDQTAEYDYICTAVGTGGTIAGLSLSALNHQKIIGFPALKNGEFLKNEIQKYSSKENFELDLRYHFGGYGKYNETLMQFMLDFNKKYQIPLDIVYTAKMMYGLLQNIENQEYSANSKILAIHTGGLQGNPKSLNFNLS